MKTLPTKQQGTAVAEKFEGQNNDNKNKQSKPNASMVSNKEKTLEKRKFNSYCSFLRQKISLINRTQQKFL